MNTQKYPRISMSEDQAREIEDLYDDILGKLKSLSIKTLEKTVTDLIDLIIGKFSSGNESLLLYTSKIFDKDYIFAHSLNVCLISIKIGIRLDFDKKRLKDLGFLGLTHARKDIGLPEELSRAIEPDKELNEIIKLTDVYDALTHPPAYRHAITPCEALSSIIKTDKFFDRRLIKILLEELSFYPKESWVQLCTKEIGKVIKVNKELLLRPMIEVFIDWEGKHLEKTKTVDLSKNNTIYVLRPLTEKEIKHIRES